MMYIITRIKKLAYYYVCGNHTIRNLLSKYKKTKKIYLLINITYVWINFIQKS